MYPASFSLTIAVPSCCLLIAIAKRKGSLLLCAVLGSLQQDGRAGKVRVCTQAVLLAGLSPGVLRGLWGSAPLCTAELL